jgi:hypothetical protein
MKKIIVRVSLFLLLLTLVLSASFVALRNNKRYAELIKIRFSDPIKEAGIAYRKGDKRLYVSPIFYPVIPGVSHDEYWTLREKHGARFVIGTGDHVDPLQIYLQPYFKRYAQKYNRSLYEKIKEK